MLRLSIIIVSWNVRDLLSACLASIAERVDWQKTEVLVVDSASSDGSAALVRERFPQVKLIACTENVGFTRGNNLALAQAQGAYLFLLNPDTVILGDALQQMMAYLDAHPDVGLLGPHTLNSDGSTQSTRRHFPTLLVGLLESTWLQALLPPAQTRHFYAQEIADDATGEVDWVQGSALLARRAVYEQIGGLDEAYVMYSEELDWCRRAKWAGWRVVYLGSADIIHHGGKSSEQASAFKHIHFQRSKLRYFRLYHGGAAAGLLRGVLLLNYAVQLALEGVKGALGHKRALRWERVQLYWQVLRSGLQVR